jgi:predicted membrane channel-forming protein YqfA (hemolysin III family)
VAAPLARSEKRQICSKPDRADRVFFLPADGTLPFPADCRLAKWSGYTEETMNGLIYLVGLIVVILAVLSFFGLR